MKQLKFFFMAAVCAVFFSCEEDESVGYSVTAFAGYGGVSAVADRENAIEGEAVTIMATPDAGFLFKEWKVRVGDVVIADVTTNPATFVMPAGEVVVVASFMIKDDIIDKTTDPVFKAYCQFRMNQSQEINGRMYDKWDTNGDGMLSKAEAAVIEAIDVTGGFGGAKVENIETMKYFTALKVLHVGDNEQTGLDLSNARNLTHLDCSGNKLSKLDLSVNRNLLVLDCSVNQLTNINISGCNQLAEFYCNNNHLAELGVGTMDISNGYILHCGNQTTTGGTSQTLILKLSDKQKDEWNARLKKLEENTGVELKTMPVGDINLEFSDAYLNTRYREISFYTEDGGELCFEFSKGVELPKLNGEYSSDGGMIILDYAYLSINGEWYEDADLKSITINAQYDENRDICEVEGYVELGDGRIVAFTYAGSI